MTAIRPGELRSAAEILLALADGKTVMKPETCGKDVLDLDNVHNDRVSFIARCRIKPEPVLRPWTEAEIEAECVKGTVLKSKALQSLRRIERDAEGRWCLERSCGSWTPSGLLEKWVIAATGAPCGVYE